MSVFSFRSIAGLTAAAVLALTIAGGTVAFADTTSPGDPTTQTTQTVTPTPPPPVAPDGGHPWID